jgi:rubrerythrin
MKIIYYVTFLTFLEPERNTMSTQGSSSSTTKDETTKLENSTYNILIALGKEAQFLYSTIDTYIEDARKDNNSELENMWKTIKEERKRHLAMLRDALEKQAKGQKLH